MGMGGGGEEGRGAGKPRAPCRPTSLFCDDVVLVLGRCEELTKHYSRPPVGLSL